MLNHVVMFKTTQADAAAEIKRRLLALPAQISAIQHYEVGINVVESGRNYDVVLISKFADAEALQTYQQDPVHLEVVDYIKSVTSSIIAVDYYEE